jgi:hypothetical protein
MQSGGGGDALGVEIEDGLDETEVDPRLQLFKLDDTDLFVAAPDSMSRRNGDALRKLGRLFH